MQVPEVQNSGESSTQRSRTLPGIDSHVLRSALSHLHRLAEAIVTWNGEDINVTLTYGGWAAVLDGFDPTPWDDDRPARGPHSLIGYGDSENQAVCDLVERLMEL